MIKIDILYFGNFCDEKLHLKDEKENKSPYRMAQYNYEKAFLDETCNINDVDIISLYQQENFPKNELYFNRKSFRKDKIKISYMPYINFPFIKEALFFINTCFKIIKWNNNSKDNERCIFSNIHYAHVSLADVAMGKLLNIKKVITFTDLSLYTYSKEKQKNMVWYKKMVIRPYIALVNRLQQSYDLYILFSKEMNNIVNPFNRPFIVMEGIYNKDELNFDKVKREKAIAYAGKLNKEVGVNKILEVFSKIKDQDLELWLLGSGDMEKDIIQASKKNKRIKFLGFKTRKEVFEYLKKAKVLVNLRNPKLEYTKYSFPSKTFEYMVSGTPFVTTKLDGIPKEYERYIFFTDYDNETIIKEIEKILKMNEEEIETIGNNAREFVINNKSAVKQVEVINKFLKSNI